MRKGGRYMIGRLCGKSVRRNGRSMGMEQERDRMKGNNIIGCLKVSYILVSLG
jgi:hypothetical protein